MGDLYERLELVVVKFDREDVVTTSVPELIEDEDED